MAETANVRTVGVVGAGQMGSGIAQVFGIAGFHVTLNDMDGDSLTRAKGTIEKSLDKLLAKEKITDDQCTHAKSIQYATALDSLATCDLIVEAIVEDESIKANLFKNLDRLVSEHTILASNTSSIPITRLASATQRPDKFIGMHFMNPVPVMRLVEVISGMATSEQTLKTITQLAHAIGKETVQSQDYPGFIVNRVLMPMINEAFRALQEGVASAKDIDAGMKLGCNQPMGPLTLADFIGLDTCVAIMEVLHQGLGDSRYAPCPLLKKYVEAGYLGVKTKHGVYEY